MFTTTPGFQTVYRLKKLENGWLYTVNSYDNKMKCYKDRDWFAKDVDELADIIKEHN